MNNPMIDGIEVEMSSGNVFADIGLPDADKLKIKSGLVVEITRAVRNLGLSQEEAGHRMGLPQAKLSRLFHGDFSNVSERKLMDCLNRLGYDIEINVKPAAKCVSFSLTYSARYGVDRKRKKELAPISSFRIEP